MSLSRERSFRHSFEMTNSNNSKSNKRIKQFSTGSRSKSNASFRGISGSKLSKVSSHDETLQDGEHRSLNVNSQVDSIKKSKSSDSLLRRRIKSGLNMTSLVRTKSYPNSEVVVHPLNKSYNNISLDLDNEDELYDVESTTEEESESNHDGNNDINIVHQELSVKNKLRQSTISHTQQYAFSSFPSHGISTAEISKKNSSNTLKDQPSYKPPSDLRNNDNEYLNNVDDIISGTSNICDNNITMTTDDNTINSTYIADMDAVSLKRQSSIILQRSISHENVHNDSINMNTLDSNVQDNNREEQPLYAPEVILSQSTGMEKRFDQIPAHHPQKYSQNLIHNNHNQNNFNNSSSPTNPSRGIYNDFDHSTTSKQYNKSQGEFKESRYQSTVKNNRKSGFTTSVSSLSSHLQRPTSNGSARLNNLLNHRNSQNFLLKNQSSPTDMTTKYLTTNDRQQKADSFNNFSQFLQSDNSGAESRTQQKLWLQRENSIMDLSAQNSTVDSIFLPSNIEARREFERISREYANVRRFGNPFNDSLVRITSRTKIEIKKHRSKPPQSDDFSFFGSYQKNNKTFRELYGYSSNREMEIQRILCKLWDEKAQDFNKDFNPLNNNTSNHHQTKNTNQNGNNGSYRQQRLFTQSLLHPTTRAVHKRMEQMSQQRI